MGSVPVVFSASPGDLQAAVQSVRERVNALAESRLYLLAVALTVLARAGRATAWQSWDSTPPATAKRFGRADITWAMRQLFETKTESLLHANSAARKVLGDPGRMMLEILYDPGAPVTLVADKPVSKGRNSVKLPLDDHGWLWSESSGPGSSPAPIEYNPVNTLGQQNGVACALSAHDAVKQNPVSPGSVYAIRRNECPHCTQTGTADPICSLNGGKCGGSGGDGARTTTKPRLIVPPVADSTSLLLTPAALPTLLAQAKSNGAALPSARDLSLIVSWCAGNGQGPMDNMRLLQLLGVSGIKLLTDS